MSVDPAPQAPAGGESRDEHDDEWLSGLRRAGLPVCTSSTPARLPASSPAVQQLIDDAWTPTTASADVRELVRRSWAPATLAAYGEDWQEFLAWCHAARIDDPLEVGGIEVAEYVATLVRDGLAVATIRRRLAGIAFAFGVMQRDSPTQTPIVRRVLEGASRTIGTAQRRATPLSLDDVRRIVIGLPLLPQRQRNEPQMRRDAVLIALGWAAALRCSELVAIDVEDLTFDGDPDTGVGGMLVRVGRSKGDQTARAEHVAVPYARQAWSCPVRLTMLQARRTRGGPLFRHIDRHHRPQKRLGADAVSRIVKSVVVEVLQVPGATYSSHSLRAGFVTEREPAASPTTASPATAATAASKCSTSTTGPPISLA